MCAVYSNGEALTENYVETPQTVLNGHQAITISEQCAMTINVECSVFTRHVSDVIT